MTLSGYHVGIEQELYQSIFNCSDNNLGVLEKGKLLESLKVINPDCRNVNFAVYYLDNPQNAYYAYKTIMRREHHFFCINEINKNTHFAYKKVLKNYLKKI